MNECTELEALRQENTHLREENRRLTELREDWTWLRVSSHLTDYEHWERPHGETYNWRWWPSWCPCCRRPLDVTLFRNQEHVAITPAPRATYDDYENRFAYAATLWGAKPGFALGALVLGASLRRSGTKHDLVLMHTDDVPPSTRVLLSRVWKLKLVELVSGDSGLFSSPGGRFTYVFTKLHVLSLTEYSKVLLLDLDIAVLRCPDELFELKAPAAMHRSITGALPHGAPIDGRSFFIGEDVPPDCQAYEWGQGSGINGGVMLFQPNERWYEKTLKEVRTPVHPERVPGNGPEQDYLSRFFAPNWTNISPTFNYQLHRIFHAMEAALYWGSAEVEHLPGRLKVEVDDLCMIHFCGELKLWDYDPANGESIEEFADRLLRDCAGYPVGLWFDETGSAEEYAAYNTKHNPDGTWTNLREDGDTKIVGTIIERGKRLAYGAALRATEVWIQAYEELPKLFQELPPLPELRNALKTPDWPEDAVFSHNEQVEVYWKGDWYPAQVEAAHTDGTFSILFEYKGFSSTGARLWPSYLRSVESSSQTSQTRQSDGDCSRTSDC